MLSGVAKSFDDFAALKPTSLEVAAGEFLTILGPSGSGKTTLLNILSGLVAPDAGDILIDGEVATKLPPHKRDIGLVFQNYALFPHLSVAENIAFPLKMRNLTRAQISERVARILEVVRLPHVADRLPRELSGGQQQRIALARCAVYEPSVILMDEPLGALDKKLRGEMQTEIRRLHSELGATIIYVTHDQEEAMAMSDRICLMRAGSIEQLGTPAELYFKPATVFAAQFFGTPNILAGRVASVDPDGGVSFDIDGNSVRVSKHAGLAQGEAGQLVIRAEALRLLKDAEKADNTIDATFLEAVVTGPMTHSWFSHRDGTSLQSLSLTSVNDRKLTRGDAVQLGWNTEEGYLLRMGTDAAA